MLNFDEPRYLKIQSGAVGQAAGIDRTVTEWLAGGADCVFFLGAGGAGILMQPACQLLALHSGLAALVEYPAQLVLTGHPRLGPKAMVVIPSLSGTTGEGVAALEFCRSRGARVMTLVGHTDTPLAQAADQAIVNYAQDDTSCESFYLQSLLLALSILRHRREYDRYSTVLAELQRLPALLLEVKRSFEARAERLASDIKSEAYLIISGAGSTWPQAFYYGMCILEEMQWIRTRPVHAGDFFHGTLELLEQNTGLLLLKGEDALRPLCERVEAFGKQHSGRLQVLDSAEFALPGISPETRKLISPVLLAAVLERVSAHLEVQRNHPLTTRRYYRRVPY